MNKLRAGMDIPAQPEIRGRSPSRAPQTRDRERSARPRRPGAASSSTQPAIDGATIPIPDDMPAPVDKKKRTAAAAKAEKKMAEIAKTRRTPLR